MRRKDERGGRAPLRGRGELGHSVTWAEAYLPTKRYPNPSSRLATTDMGRGLYGRRLSLSVNRESGAGAAVPLSVEGSWVSV